MPDKPIEGVIYRPRVDSRVGRRVLAVHQCHKTHSPWWSVDYVDEGDIIVKHVGEGTWLAWIEDTLAQPASERASSDLGGSGASLPR